ncbi:MAG: glucose-1-phosphate cytidylyltransferase [Pseudomonadota bacterium]|nr:glucose-1-phosphate cytidylyltransferase [Pseudomonadota bacterium]
MKAVILAGGYGTRISEETGLRPKPMIEIGGRPLLWHIMKIYSAHGINEFVICCGYKGYMIKEYFANYFLHTSDLTVNLENSDIRIHQRRAEPWTITMVDTGTDTMTGGRLLRVRDYLENSTFCMTYGDGVSDVNIADLVKYHASHGKLGTVTAVQPPGRFGAVSFRDGTDAITSFLEKPKGDNAWINGGFFVLEPGIFDYLENERTVWEQGPLSRLAADDQLMAWRHRGFWSSVDTLRDKNHLEELWNTDHCPWKTRA